MPFTTISEKILCKDVFPLFPLASLAKSASSNIPTSISYYKVAVIRNLTFPLQSFSYPSQKFNLDSFPLLLNKLNLANVPRYYNCELFCGQCLAALFGAPFLQPLQSWNRLCCAPQLNYIFFSFPLQDAVSTYQTCERIIDYISFRIPDESFSALPNCIGIVRRFMHNHGQDSVEMGHNSLEAVLLCAPDGYHCVDLSLYKVNLQRL